jgi:hypothetical protein
MLLLGLCQDWHVDATSVRVKGWGTEKYPQALLTPINDIKKMKYVTVGHLLLHLQLQQGEEGKK